MKKLAKLIYNLCYWIDSKMNWIEKYDYETAPYCGHHYNGHKGKLTYSDQSEVGGQSWLNTKNPFLKIGYHTEEGWMWVSPLIKTTIVFKNGLSDNEYFGIKGVKRGIEMSKKIRLAEGKSKDGIKIMSKIKFQLV